MSMCLHARAWTRIDFCIIISILTAWSRSFTAIGLALMKSGQVVATASWIANNVLARRCGGEGGHGRGNTSALQMCVHDDSTGQFPSKRRGST